ncbi:hypothetical protein [Micromonospora sp. RTP1Z1]|uniref:hypothetical protein n=1 Tax=Micromonospora sp. RTP1Z1 TaxID=2994043 RepID=UPI0029C633C3|nr:hypothetical protein [Micromonospora sp. RTP1Z1]
MQPPPRFPADNLIDELCALIAGYHLGDRHAQVVTYRPAHRPQAEDLRPRPRSRSAIKLSTAKLKATAPDGGARAYPHR